MQGFELLGNIGSNPSDILEEQGWELCKPVGQNTSGIIVAGNGGGKALSLVTSSTTASAVAGSLLRHSLNTTIPSETQSGLTIPLVDNATFGVSL
jgi:hypothetical protein